MTDNDRKNFDGEQLLRIHEVALYMRVKSRTVELWLERGILRAVRPAGTRITRIPVSELQRLLSSDRGGVAV